MKFTDKFKIETIFTIIDIYAMAGMAPAVSNDKGSVKYRLSGARTSVDDGVINVTVLGVSDKDDVVGRIIIQLRDDIIDVQYRDNDSEAINGDDLIELLYQKLVTKLANAISDQ